MDVLGLRLTGPLGHGLSRLLLASGCALGILAMSAGSASAGLLSGYGSRHTCTGTLEEPGVLAGDYSGHVSIEGACVVDAGAAVVHGDLTVEPGAVLLAAFALNDQTGTGTSSLRVNGDLLVKDGATVLLGCEAEHFACIDDPNPEHPTLSAEEHISGDLREHKPLGVVVHSTTIGGDVTETGGGGGFTCEPSGPFAAFKVPVYSDYEDTQVGGNIEIEGLTSCWLGIARVHVDGNVRLKNNQLADPDAIEVVANDIEGNLKCEQNSRVWDSAEQSEKSIFPRTPAPNVVEGKRSGQCVLASPATEGGPLGPGPF